MISKGLRITWTSRMGSPCSKPLDSRSNAATGSASSRKVNSVLPPFLSPMAIIGCTGAHDAPASRAAAHHVPAWSKLS